MKFAYVILLKKGASYEEKKQEPKIIPWLLNDPLQIIKKYIILKKSYLKNGGI